jgi:hypothetical protein
VVPLQKNKKTWLIANFKQRNPFSVPNRVTIPFTNV